MLISSYSFHLAVAYRPKKPEFRRAYSGANIQDNFEFRRLLDFCYR